MTVLMFWIGASGFIAAATCQALVDRGFTVVGTVRTKSKGEYLEKLFGPKFTHAIVADIESVRYQHILHFTFEQPAHVSFQLEAFDHVVKDGYFDGIIHMASPVILGSADPPAVIGPAVTGTKNILSAALKYGYVDILPSVTYSPYLVNADLPWKGSWSPPRSRPSLYPSIHLAPSPRKTGIRIALATWRAKERMLMFTSIELAKL